MPTPPGTQPAGPLKAGARSDDNCTMTVTPDELDGLAERLTRHLGIPFRPTTKGTVVFRDRLRTTDWAVPLMFDGHAAREDDGAIVPTDFVGHALWPHLRSATQVRTGRQRWTCSLEPHVAQSLLDELASDEPDEDGQWSVEMLVEAPPLRHPRAHHRSAA